MTPPASLRPLALLPPVLLLLLGPGSGCGKKGPPQPPPRMVPAATKDLTVQQRGTELLLEFAYPATTIGGLALEGLESVEVWELVRPLYPPTDEEVTDEEATDEEGAVDEEPDGEPAEEPVEEPAPAAGESEPESGDADEKEKEEGEEEPRPEDLVRVEAAEFVATATLLRTLSGPELSAAVSGDRIVVRIPAGDIPAAQDEARIFAVKAIAGKRLYSDLSNLAVIVPRIPPPAPEIVSITPSQRGIALSWQSEAEGEGFRVYRRDAQARTYGDALASKPSEARQHDDTSARFGSRYIYTVTLVAAERPLVESAVSSEHEIDYQDRFAPPPPRNLVALAESGRVRLLWEPSEADDVAGYVVERRRAGEEFAPLGTEPVVELELLDTDVTRGSSYDYRVLAVDVVGNRGEPGEPISARVP